MDILVPISICCILPIAVVLIVFLGQMNADNKKSQVLMKAIESGSDIDYEKLAEMLGKSKRTPREVLNARLLRGCIFSLVGLVLIVISLTVQFSGFSFGDDDVFGPMILGGVFLAVGAGYLIVFFVTRKDVKE